MADVADRSASGGAAVPALLGLALAYGLLHALGPGHRKLALAAVYGLYYLFLGPVSAAFSSLSWILELGSYGAITLLRLVLLALSIRGRLRSRRGGHGAYGGPARGDRTLAAVMAIAVSCGDFGHPHVIIDTSLEVYSDERG